MTRLVIPSLAVAAMLVATIGWEARSVLSPGSSERPGHLTPSTVASITPVYAPADPVEAWVTASLARPLLRETRRPDEAADDTQGKGDDSLRLAAVMTGPFGNRAIFMLPGTTKPALARVGEHMSGFIVQSIDPGRVVVESNGDTHTYRPMYAGSNRRLAVTSKR
ncbi:MAG: hypothetical protein QOG73_2097 [Acetobacteraceae bacterium]|nr:hypothetical protein [Acetobacteraceae bacterium]